MARPRGGPSKAYTVNVSLQEWHLILDTQEVQAGPVTFRVSNLGDEEHELVVIKTGLRKHALPILHGKVAESAAGEPIGEIEEFPRVR